METYNSQNLFKSNFLFFNRKIILSFCIATWEQKYVEEYPSNLNELPPLEPMFFLSENEDTETKNLWIAKLQVSNIV